MMMLSEDDVLDAAIMDSLLDSVLAASPRPNYQVRQRHELVQLRDEAVTLAAHLSALRSIKRVEVEASAGAWEKIARNQKLALDTALLENTRLKRALEDHLEFADALQHAMTKRPRLSSMAAADFVDWKVRRLPLDPLGRRAAFDGMLNDAYNSIETLYVRSGILDAASGHHVVKVHEAVDALCVNMRSVAEVAKDHFACSDSVWTFMQSKSNDVLPHVTFEVVETFGDDGIYIRITAAAQAGTPCTHLMFAMKRFVEIDKITLVLKTFLEDASHKPPPGVLIGNHTACVVFEALDDHRTCRRFCAEGKFPTNVPAANPLLLEALPPSDALANFMEPIFTALEESLQ
ncbi:hypothetical protein SPRG_05994 [Saprolegnia parasitica CBS 223.65]|uniref:START domain-containing protein n=1 Tax=Saprolegnia parasitica (strain CBS 223.65) TaxID=695850 RepID=A0A067CSE2_SAPPC|nr:hypothetical protein SPRG_05994 [Saprolegnia parasitica CBS 223.65]KDO29456.1 hypothetical protein SPRG_05994 [Saprolegnia parasitica CBS 223.65]|eukprot:XP_012199955.1 hypothetical protein SPRG_05994 [Saprolegnia parasitica CBS 223.65]